MSESEQCKTHGGWIWGGLLAELPVFYVLSVGPAVWLYDRGLLPLVMAKPI